MNEQWLVAACALAVSLAALGLGCAIGEVLWRRQRRKDEK